MNHFVTEKYASDLANPATISSPGGLCARWIASTSELESMTPVWNQLIDHSISRNPSFEPEFLIPALNHLNQSEAKCLVVEGDSGQGDRRLLGLMPLAESKVYGLPFKSVVAWKHEQCFDTTPLLHREYGAQVIATMFEFLKEQKFGLLKLDTMSAASNITNPILSVLNTQGMSLFVVDTFERATFEPAQDVETYLVNNLSKGMRKKVKQCQRRLGELGDVVYEPCSPHSDYPLLAQQFLDLEQSGWKGKNETALASERHSKQFFLESVERLAQSGKARFLTLKLSGTPIAMILNTRSGSSAFAFKTAFDETMSKYSPGILVEVHSLGRMHADGINFADSCTTPDNTTMKRIWGQKASFQSIVVGLHKGAPSMALKALPLMQMLVRSVRELKSKIQST